MRIALLTYGTRGDVQPYVAVAHALAQRGHEIGLAAHWNHQGFIESAGIRCVPIPINSQELLEGILKPSLAAGDTRHFIRLLAAAEHDA